MKKKTRSPWLIALAIGAVGATGCTDTPTEPRSAEIDALDISADGGNNGRRARGKIVFADGGDIWVMNADGSARKNLTPGGPGVDDTPSWSRNGKRIVFSSDRRNPGRPGGFPPNGQGGPQHEIYIMNADGSNVRRVTTTDQRDLFPHLSPNGKKVVFSRDLDFINVPQIFVINVDGTQETNLTNNPSPNCFPPPNPDCAFEARPRWSPNGKKILFNRATVPSDADVFVMRANGTRRTNLTNSPGSNDFWADWSPNGKRVVFTGGPPGESDIFIMKANGSRLRQVTTDGGAALDFAPVWSPNGRMVAFHSVAGGPPTIFSIKRNGTGQTPLSAGAFADWTRGRVW